MQPLTLPLSLWRRQFRNPPGWHKTPHCCQARQRVPPFFPHQPACSHHCVFPAEAFARLWASWNTGLVQVKANPTKTTSDAQRQHTENRHPEQGEAIIPFCSSTDLCQTKAMTTSDWLASSQTLSKYSSNKFFCTSLSIACSCILIQTLGWMYIMGAISEIR